MTRLPEGRTALKNDEKGIIDDLHHVTSMTGISKNPVAGEYAHTGRFV
ncbi:MAG: hypothetical protein ACLTCQ_17805 [Enterocloster bolteae]